jgi:hypothetical protein
LIFEKGGLDILWGYENLGGHTGANIAIDGFVQLRRYRQIPILSLYLISLG